VLRNINPVKAPIRETGEESGRREKWPTKLGRREKNELKNREIRYLPTRSSPLWQAL